MTDKQKWEISEGHSNHILTGEGFIISYQPDPNAAPDISGFGASDNNSVETAIVTDEGNYYILNGDFRKDYEKLVEKGLAVCVEFFKDHEKHKSSWSN